MSSKTEIKQINLRNLIIVKRCLQKSRKTFDVGYYSGKMDALNHIQMLLEEKPSNV